LESSPGADVAKELGDNVVFVQPSITRVLLKD